MDFACLSGGCSTSRRWLCALLVATSAFPGSLWADATSASKGGSNDALKWRSRVASVERENRTRDIVTPPSVNSPLSWRERGGAEGTSEPWVPPTTRSTPSTTPPMYPAITAPVTLGSPIGQPPESAAPVISQPVVNPPEFPSPSDRDTSVRDTSVRETTVREPERPDPAGRLGVSLTPPRDGAATPPSSRPAAPREPGKVSEELQHKLRKPGDLSFSGMSLREALLTISSNWSVNIFFGADVNGTVNGSFQNAPLYEILHAILSANGYGYRAVGDSLAVLKTDQLGDLNPLFETAVVVLRVAQPADVVKSAKLFSTPGGKVEAIDSARTVVIVDMPERVELIRRFAEQVDAEAARSLVVYDNAPRTRRVMHVQLQHVDAKSISDAVQPLLSKANGIPGLEDGKATFIPGENRLVVMDYPHILAMIAEAVHIWDQPRTQVRITALIYDVNLDYLERVGLKITGGQNINSGSTGTGAGGTTSGGSGGTSGTSSNSMFSIESVVQSAVTGAPGTVTLMNLSKHLDIKSVVNLLRRDSDSRLLADPSVLVTNRSQAKIQIVTEIPYQQLTQTTQGGNIGTTEFKQAGVTLEVTPHIALDGTLELEVKPEFSRLIGFTTGASPQPIIDRREAKTRVRVVDGQTIVIGGLRQRSDVNAISGIPGLKNRKIIGKLFRSREEATNESELIVFITPEIVSPLYQGRPREASAFQAGNAFLDRVPIGIDPYGGVPAPCPPSVETVVPPMPGTISEPQRRLPQPPTVPPAPPLGPMLQNPLHQSPQYAPPQFPPQPQFPQPQNPQPLPPPQYRSAPETVPTPPPASSSGVRAPGISVPPSTPQPLPALQPASPPAPGPQSVLLTPPRAPQNRDIGPALQPARPAAPAMRPPQPPAPTYPNLPLPPPPVDDDPPPLPDDYSRSGLFRPENNQQAGSFRVASRPPLTRGLSSGNTAPPASGPAPNPDVTPRQATNSRFGLRNMFSRATAPTPAPATNSTRVASRPIRLPSVDNTPAPAPSREETRQAARPSEATSSRWLDGVLRR